MRSNIIFTSTKFSSNFNVKDSVPFTAKLDVIYRSVCATESCNESFVGECARRLYERVKDHNGHNYKSHLVKHAGESGDVEVFGSGYRNNARRRKIAEALAVKKQKPT